ncbi:MAG: hypothetical protein WAV00_04130 [Nocardioides sp.]
MSTTSITHRPTSYVAAAAGVAVIAVGSLFLVVSQGGGQPSAPADQAKTSVQHTTSQDFRPTTSGGRVMVGE